MTKLGSYLLTAHCLPPPRSPLYWRWCLQATKYLHTSHGPEFTPVGLVGAQEHWRGTGDLPHCVGASALHLHCGWGISSPGWGERQGAAPALRGALALLSARAAFATERRQWTALWHYLAGLSNM